MTVGILMTAKLLWTENTLITVAIADLYSKSRVHQCTIRANIEQLNRRRRYMDNLIGKLRELDDGNETDV